MEITHPDKILFPKEKISKEELVLYYAKVAKLMLPLVKNRPISLEQFPHGIHKGGFFQKKAPPSHPPWVKTARVKRKGNTPFDMILCNDKKTLLYLANQNCITPHIWLSKWDKPEYPDRMVFDLDPPVRKEWQHIAQAALIVKEVVENRYNLSCFLNTTGGKGLHLVVPIKRNRTFDEVRAFAKEIADEAVEDAPRLLTTQVHKNKRGGKIYIDTLRNGYGQTVAAPYAVRPLKGAPIATPIGWDELKGHPRFTIGTIEKRLKKNPWSGMDRKAKTLPST